MPQPTKHLQKFAYLSETWRSWMGVRSLVEAFDNINRIRTFFYRADKKAELPKRRARRRKDANGLPLPRRKSANAPPR